MNATLRLRTVSPFLDPAWFQVVRHGVHRGVVKEDGVVDLLGVALRAEGSVAPGVELEIWIDGSGHFAAATVEEVARQKAEDAARWERERIERAQQLEAQAQANAAFNAALRLPVAWRPGIKDVLSGLAEGSRGDGFNRRTVHHIWLQADLAVGRFRRRAGDFLCTSAGASNGKMWSGQPGAGLGSARVSCKACLAAARRFRSAA